jgi:hypothetical protein
MRFGISLFILLFTLPVMAVDSKKTLPSRFSVEQTADRYLSILQDEGVRVLSREKKKINRAPKQVIRFLNPYYGTSIGRCGHGERMDSSIEAKIWQDTRGKVWLAYEEPKPTVNQFGVIECGNETDIMRKALDQYAHTATGE